MTEEMFRIKHSMLIEYYQYIEIHLKNICVNLIGKKDGYLFERLEEFQSDTLGKLIHLIKEGQLQKQIELFSPEDFEDLERIRQRRNFWVHACFSDYNHVTFRDGKVKRPLFAQDIVQDLQEAIDWDENVTEAGRTLSKRMAGG